MLRHQFVSLNFLECPQRHRVSEFNLLTALRLAVRRLTFDLEICFRTLAGPRYQHSPRSINVDMDRLSTSVLSDTPRNIVRSPPTWPSGHMEVEFIDPDFARGAVPSPGELQSPTSS